MRTRFAPSPTGLLHIGNMRTALLCYLYAKKVGGEFLLRVDDTDSERSKEEYVDALKHDLQWLGLQWDDTMRQSERFDKYDAAVEKLKASGRLYPCYETQQELEIKRKMQMSRGQPPIYDREGLTLTDAQKAKFEAEGLTPHWRFKLDDNAIEWNDEIRGETKFEGKNLSDPILVRENGAYTYMLPSTVDDIDLNITHVLRGEDHVSNTAIQIQLFEALGGKVPSFAHNALIKTKEGKLSKRKGSNTIGELRDEGIEPMALNSFLAKIGTSDPVDIRQSLDELVGEFDISKFSRAPTMYSLDEVHRLNEKLMHMLPFEAVKDRLPNGADAAFWDTVRANITTVSEAAEWWRICKETVTPVIDDGSFTEQASTLLPEGDWDSDTWPQWIDTVKNTTGRKGKELFMPLRKALTGMDHGPELKDLLPLIGRERTVARLHGKAA